MNTKKEKIETLEKIMLKTNDHKKIRILRDRIDKIKSCDCGGWCTSNEHHYDWCSSKKVFSYNDYYMNNSDYF